MDEVKGSKGEAAHVLNMDCGDIEWERCLYHVATRIAEGRLRGDKQRGEVGAEARKQAQNRVRGLLRFVAADMDKHGVPRYLLLLALGDGSEGLTGLTTLLRQLRVVSAIAALRAPDKRRAGNKWEAMLRKRLGIVEGEAAVDGGGEDS